MLETFYLLTTIEKICFAIIIILIIILLFINKNKIFSNFENNDTENESNLTKDGFIKNELVPSYWYNYAPSEIRSKCFACDANSNYRHPSNCIDCETKGGRPVDKLFNRVLTR
jgi:hypothetical protein